MTRSQATVLAFDYCLSGSGHGSIVTVNNCLMHTSYRRLEKKQFFV